MSFTVTDTKTYDFPTAAVFQAALGAVEGLKGELLNQDSAKGQIEVKFDKKILGKVLGDRTQMKVEIREDGPGSTTVAVEVYPLDAIGRKLMFGARKGVSATVMSWFYAHLEHRLKPGD